MAREDSQSAAEELETLAEELQAATDELNTARGDLRAGTLELRETVLSLEEQRRQSAEEHARLQAVLASMAEAVLVVGADGRTLLTNQAYTDLFGSSVADIVAEDSSGRQLAVDERPERRAARGESFTMNFTYLMPDGERRWLEASGQPIRNGGEQQGAVVVIRDITERSLRRLQEEFMAIASHELRTPLTVLHGYLEMLNRRLSRENAEVQLRYASRALAQTKRLAELVTNLLDVSRLQNGKMELDLEPVQLVPLVAQTVDIARSLAQGQAITFAADDAGLAVSAEPARLEQVLMNLLTNAIRYAPGTERIDVRVRRHQAHALIEVRDYGPGIPGAELPNLFRRFYQVGDGRGRQRMGLGLGLFICNEIVRAHGGGIDVTSAEGHGSTFTVRLPLSVPIR